MNIVKGLGASAAVLGLGAPFVGSPYLTERAHIDIGSIAKEIAIGADHIAPLDLATWIRERRPRLRVIDVRRREEFAEFAIPTAENIPLELLPRAVFAADETLVLYSEGGAHAAQAWMMLRAMGHRSVYFISGGLVDWYWDVMNPTLSRDASDEERVAFEQVAELSRYFGGVPQLETETRAERSNGAQNVPRIATLRRRGC